MENKEEKPLTLEDVLSKVILAAVAAIVWGAFSIHMGLGIIVLAVLVILIIIMLLK